MAIAKVILNGVTQMDVTQKTVTAGSMLSGTTALKNDGTDITGSIASQAAQTIHPSTTDQTIASGKYLTGAQTIKAVTTTNLTAANIVQGVTVKIGDSTDDDCVASVTGTAATGGDDFVITLTKNASTGIWEPDCTYAEAQAAYDGGKNVAFEASLDGSPIPCGEYSRTSNKIKYSVFEPVVTSNDFVFNYIGYIWDILGINAQNPYPYYDTNSATAVPADVASGKVFYNASGYQVGTASGGGGGGISGVAKGTLTVDATVSTSTSVDITTTTEIGFTPTKFFFYKDTNTGTDAVIYMSTYADIGSKYIRVRAVYDARNAMASVSGNYMNWTSSSSGYLYFASDTVKISTSSSYKLEAGTYTWLAVL